MDLNPGVLYSLLREDLDRWCPIDGTLFDQWHPDASPKEVAAHRQVSSFFKKFVENTADDADAKAISKFLAANRKCSEWEWRPEWSVDEVLLGEFQRLIERFWYLDGDTSLVESFSVLFDAGRNGPGDAVGADWESAYTKLFASPLTTTSSTLYKEYSRHLESHPIWRDAELCRCRQYGDPQVVEGGRLGCVPKRTDISRTIETQPVLNMFLQLGFGSILSSRLLDYFGVNLEDQQDKNRELARRGSLARGLSTLDLEGASDSVSMKMVRKTFPKSFVALLEMLRTPCVSLPDGERVELEMVSTMGNGFTFPLETLIFSCVVIAVYRVYGMEPYLWDRPFERGADFEPVNFGVFGDDIICASTLAAQVERFLGLLGFTVNRSKSFVEGPFRESCGADWFLGKEVRPVYVKSLGTLQERFALINGLNRWTAKTGLPLTLTVRYLLIFVPYHGVPRWEGDDAGLHLPLSRVVSPRRSAMSSKHRLDLGAPPLYQGSFKYYAWTARAPRLVFDEDGTARLEFHSKARTVRQKIGRVKLMHRKVPMPNPDGLLLMFLEGYIRHGALTIRQRSGEGTYVLQPRIAPSWDDPIGPTEAATRVGTWEWPWETAIHLNLP